ncbi:hypothetical protein DICPUDRAFT_154255 [Dictyostelium purpureum]|uniref:AB hydrolase-1 domain-containing protein n=1 Tax=Dictyostelium purpureum TaxID=5786 RepID=F0ZQV4_DICPU|nr:uncharacterized protein DICPUDRAFT_154255 [Dictyostelium purpureum]EGC33683.1 hypothetical protein DICPUDRAFT_154255 [Dictyostelium purpureum]|eukprot:XP_003289802.1 hypothetical protein DICPUDRAFT_154255 [Dictyostelium purpureum]
MIRNLIFNKNNLNKIRQFCTLTDGKPVDLVFHVQKPSHLKPNDNQSVKNIIILHGLFGAGSNWKSVSHKIADGTNCTVFQVDQRNHGASPHTKEFNYKVMSDDIDQIIKKQNLNDVAIIGHSLGGRVAMLYSLLYPETINKLVVVDISPSHLTSHSIAEFRGFLERMDSMDLHNIRTRKQAEEWLEPVITNKGVRLFILTNLILGENGQFRWRLNIKGLLDKLDNINTFPTQLEITEMSSNNKSGTFSKDTLFIVGEKSGFLEKNKDTSVMYSYFPNINDIVVVPNAGHWVHADNADLFSKIISEFINDTKLQ